MEMGYILKIARDTDILAGSEYTSHEDFASKRYDLDKGTVSRYIRIVERFSVDGNSHLLKDNYKNMGFSKLSLMLHMPDAIAEELMDSLSKTDVLAIKEELDAEAQITDIELAIEQAETPVPEHAVEGTLLQRTIRQLGHEQPDLYRKIWQAFPVRSAVDIAEILAPHGDAVYMVRIPGMGRIMLSIQGDDVSVTAVRTQEKERHIMEEVHDAWRRLCYLQLSTAEESYREEYGEEMPAKEAPTPQNAGVAPVQPPQPRKQSKVTKANTGKSKNSEKVFPAAVVQEPEEQLPGQMEVSDFPELLPENNEVDGGRPVAGESGTAAAGVKETMDRTQMEGSNGESDECGNNTGVSDGAGDFGNDVESGSAQRGEDTVSEHHEGAGASESGGCEADNGVSESGDALAEILKENLAAGIGGDMDLLDLWDKAAMSVKELREFFFTFSKEDLEACIIEEETLWEQYISAINVAAALERIINVQKYTS